MALSFIKAMSDYFGRKPGQSVGEFSAELKALSHEDKLYFVREFKKIGMDVLPPSAPVSG
jgi:hypothetical protein